MTHDCKFTDEEHTHTPRTIIKRVDLQEMMHLRGADGVSRRKRKVSDGLQRVLRAENKGTVVGRVRSSLCLCPNGIQLPNIQRGNDDALATLRRFVDKHCQMISVRLLGIDVSGDRKATLLRVEHFNDGMVDEDV